MLDRDFFKDLEEGCVRVAAPTLHNTWEVHLDVKQRIIEFFRHAKTIDMGEDASSPYHGFVDKEGLTPRLFSSQDAVRLVPGGTAVRPGTYIGKSVVIMPPSFINVGAYIDDGTMVDSHVLVGSCAQIGKNVHLSTGVLIGGVLEPLGNRPVIVEDECFVGAGAILTEGILVRKRAVVAPGVILSAAVPIYDTVHHKIYKGEIPSEAVVVPGTRPLASSAWAQEQHLALNCAIIVKYRDEKTDAALQLEDALRSMP